MSTVLQARSIGHGNDYLREGLSPSIVNSNSIISYYVVTVYCSTDLELGIRVLRVHWTIGNGMRHAARRVSHSIFKLK